MFKKHVLLLLFLVVTVNIPVIAMNFKALYPENNYQKIALGSAALGLSSGLTYGYTAGLASYNGINTLLGTSDHFKSLMFIGLPLLSISLCSMKGMPDFLKKVASIKQGLTKEHVLNAGIGSVQAVGAFLTLGFAAVSGRFAGDFIGHCSGHVVPYISSVLNKL